MPEKSKKTSGSAKPPAAHSQPIVEGERLQKIIAAAGIASRRKAEELIAEGRVQVNGQVVTELGTKADPHKDHIRVDGKLLHGPEPHKYFMLNKPRGYVTTVSDPENRPTVMTLMERAGARIYPVGRLDYLSEGLLLMTNDGNLANALTKAAAGVEKTYLVKVSGTSAEAQIEQLRRGIMIDRGRAAIPGETAVGPVRRDRVMTAPAKVKVARGGENPWYEVSLIEGRNRQLRKMFEEIGHHVEKIRRVGFGPLVLDVAPGEFRELTPGEVTALDRASKGKKVEQKRVKPEFARLKTPTKAKKHSGRRSARSR
ncbi:MAG: pseudouridine synthase [Acidobacteriaceae bacterium]